MCRTNDTRPGRREFIGSALGVLSVASSAFTAQLSGTKGTSLTKDERDRMTPQQVIEELKKGNERFRTGRMIPRDYLGEKRSSASGQFPAAVILSCVDSRVPVEIVLDTGIGDIFVCRIAGNVSDDDVLGSLEFACAASGAKVVLVMGHTSCGAIKGAIDGVVMENLTRLLSHINPAIPATPFHGERSSSNHAFVDAVAQTNVALTVEEIRHRSATLSDLEKNGTIKIVGAMYNLESGKADFIA